ncbi:hypothetical protein NQZ68_036885 [Dissostichus eleginoides]|nr:hypothetical protein NQZ68_036885 [Dissostichus eleginoides]
MLASYRESDKCAPRGQKEVMSSDHAALLLPLSKHSYTKRTRRKIVGQPIVDGTLPRIISWGCKICMEEGSNEVVEVGGAGMFSARLSIYTPDHLDHERSTIRSDFEIPFFVIQDQTTQPDFVPLIYAI